MVKKIRHIEDDLQEVLVRLFRLSVPKHKARIFSIPNGGYRNALEAQRLIEQGATKGIPDLQIIMDQGRVVWVEVKRPKNVLLKQAAGKLSESQEEVHEFLRSVGHKVFVVDSIYQFQDLLKSLGLIKF